MQESDNDWGGGGGCKYTIKKGGLTVTISLSYEGVRNKIKQGGGRGGGESKKVIG